MEISILAGGGGGGGIPLSSFLPSSSSPLVSSVRIGARHFGGNGNRPFIGRAADVCRTESHINLVHSLIARLACLGFFLILRLVKMNNLQPSAHSLVRLSLSSR